MGETGGRNRSPIHPAVSLPEALDVASTVMEREGFSYAPVGVVMAHLNYSPKSSSGLRKLAALIHFGLAEDTGSGDERRIRLTDLAKRILRAQVQGSDSSGLMEKAALHPAIYRKLWEAWYRDGPRPSETTQRWDLVHEWNFNPTAIDGFLRDFQETLSFAGIDGDLEQDLGESPGRTEQPDEAAHEANDLFAGPEVRNEAIESAPASTGQVPEEAGENRTTTSTASGTRAEVGESITIMLSQGVATLSSPRPLSIADLDAVAAWVDYARRVRAQG